MMIRFDLFAVVKMFLVAVFKLFPKLLDAARWSDIDYGLKSLFRTLPTSSPMSLRVM